MSRFQDQHANAKAALALARAIVAKLHDRGVISDEDLEDIRSWAMEDLAGSEISSAAARGLIEQAMP